MNIHSQPPAVLTTCPYCGVGCGVRVQADALAGATVTGDPDHPANFGRLCSKGAALGETIGLEGRLLYPQIRQADGTLMRTDWSSAIAQVADGFKRIIERDGPNAVAFYLSGQLLTEDYYVANKLMKGFVGSANVDTNSRLCMASSVAGHRRAFGADTVPGTYADLDEADLIVLVGSNTAWCHPVLFQRMVANRERRASKIVVIDPRRTATGDEADLFLPIAPGTDTVLFAGLLVHLADRLALDYGYIDRYTTDFENALMRAREIAPDIATIAAATGLDSDAVLRFFELFRTTPRVVTCYSQGVNQSAQGTDKVNAIVNCHLATGRIGKCGMGPLSLTGQPNAMGGREVGGLANQLAAHMGFAPEDVDRVGRFWAAPRMATREGLKAVQMFEAIERGEIKALWVMATNPAVSLPRAAGVRAGLRKLELFVVSENVVSNDTVNAGTHVLLPAAAWGEKDGTVTNSERRISRQRAFLPPPGEARPDWWIVAQVAQHMGFADGFAFRSAADVFREHAALSAFENCGTRDFDLGGLAELSDEGYAALEPVQWPIPSAEEVAGRNVDDKRFFAKGAFYTPDRKARFIAPDAPALREALSADYPFRLNTGRIRDQWHTMTRSGRSPRLGSHLPEPFVEIHPADAQANGLADGDLAKVATPHGSAVVKVMVSEGQQPGALFMPIHWSAETSSGACVGDLVAPITDPFSGQPEAKATPATITPVKYALRGFIRARMPVTLPADTWWTSVAAAGGSEYRFATNDGLLSWHDFAHRAFGGDALISEQIDAERGLYRAVAFIDGELAACLAVQPPATPPAYESLAALIAAGPPRDGISVTPALAGFDEHVDASPVVCACFGVTQDAVRAVVAEGAADVAAVGAACRAGTNCGSCLPELKRMIARGRVAQAA
jgi:assimilatory nitrate reductase catalytic subunit